MNEHDILKKFERRLEDYPFRWVCQTSGCDELDQGDKPSILLSEEFYFQYFQN
jgi:hypothetical protein